ncbi:MAG: 2TM domain-containing protein [Bacteroidetes bacterium]|nr:2TM domain-containing protein [Bacteroidota bacterium]
MRILKELWRAFFIGVLIFIVIGVIQYLNGYSYDTGKEILIVFGYNQLYSIVLYMANMLLINYLIKRYGSKLFKLQNLLKGIFGGMIVTVVALFLLHLFSKVVIQDTSITDFIGTERIEHYYGSFIISMVITAIFYAIYFYRYKQENKVKEQKIIAKTASAQFDALKNQLDPHFLFNSLNVLTSLIEENPEAATRFTTALSKVYRYVLEQKNKELVTVAEELKFAKLYMSLIKMRFEDSIVFTVPETVSNLEARVVPLSLQLLLENAVKHNQVTPSKKLHISIKEEDGNLMVVNNIQPKKVLKKSSGVGLQNIRQRYGIITDRPMKIYQDERTFSVSIPMLTTHVTVVKETQKEYISAKKYELAKKKVEALKGFYIHFGIYCVMVLVFIYLNVISTGFPWALFPIVGWGFGVAGHAMETFNYNPLLGKDWEARKIRELMDKDKD